MGGGGVRTEFTTFLFMQTYYLKYKKVAKKRGHFLQNSLKVAKNGWGGEHFLQNTPHSDSCKHITILKYTKCCKKRGGTS